MASNLDRFFSSKAPEFDYASVAQKDGQATLAGSSPILAAFAGKIENMIIASADLSNSDMTDGFLKKTKAVGVGHIADKIDKRQVAADGSRESRLRTKNQVTEYAARPDL